MNLRLFTLLLLAVLSCHARAADSTSQGSWSRLEVTALGSGQAPVLEHLWRDRLSEGMQRWESTGRPGQYPARAQSTVLNGASGPVLVSVMSGLYECSVAGSFDKSDLWTTCALRIQTKSKLLKLPGCWIESEAGMTPNPTTHFMRASLNAAGDAVTVQVVQAGRVVTACDKHVSLR